MSSIAEAHARAQAGAAGAVNRYLTIRNWLIGAYIVEFEQSGKDRAIYGQQLLTRLSGDLKLRKIPGCSPELLGRMRLFYRTYPQVWETFASPFTRGLGGLRARTDRSRISSPVATKSKMALPTPLDGQTLLRLPWSHLVELIRLDDPWKRAFYENECLRASWSRLVFYHRLLRCHLLIDLKVRQFQHGDAGQMNFYLNYWKQEVTSPQDNPPVGLLLCSDKDQTRVEYAIGGLDQQMFVSRYLVVLPKANEIEHLIERDRALWEQRGRTNSPRLRGSPAAP